MVRPGGAAIYSRSRRGQSLRGISGRRVAPAHLQIGPRPGDCLRRLRLDPGRRRSTIGCAADLRGPRRTTHCIRREEMVIARRLAVHSRRRLIRSGLFAVLAPVLAACGGAAPTSTPVPAKPVEAPKPTEAPKPAAAPTVAPATAAAT